MSPLSSSVPQSLSFSYTHVRPRCSQNSSGNLWDPIPNLDNITPTALSSEPTLHPSVYEAVLSQVDCQDSAGLEAVLRLWNIWHIFKLAVYGVMLLLGFCLFSVSLGLRLTELNPGGAVCLFVMVSLSAWHYPAEDCVHLVDEISWKWKARIG